MTARIVTKHAKPRSLPPPLSVLELRAKEELQSVNEELATVNTELQTKVVDLLRANNDMNNLLAGSGIGTVFVDHQLRILRFTAAASKIINLILSDVGRPVAHIASSSPGTPARCGCMAGAKPRRCR